MNNEAILKAACIAADEELSAGLLALVNSMPDISVSEAEREKILSVLIPGSTKKKKTHKKALRVLLAAAIILLLTALTVFAVKPLRNFVVEMFKDESRIIFSQSEGRSSLYPHYDYIPEGYVLTDIKKGKTSQWLEYKCGIYGLNIKSLPNDNSVALFDSENAETGEIKVGDTVGYYSITNDTLFLMWSVGNYNYRISADRNDKLIGLDELVKIAQSQKS